MKTNSNAILIVLTLGMLIFFSTELSFAESLDSTIFPTIESLKISNELIKQKLSENDHDNAKQLSKFSSELFGKNISNFRSSNSELTNEIHLLILDIHTGISSKSPSRDIIPKITHLDELLDQFQISTVDYDKSIVFILTIADEQYQIANQKNNVMAYSLSEKLVEKSHEIFGKHSNFNERLTLEVNSFFAELKHLIENKESFVQTGNIITAIQRDILGSETVVFSNDNLYNQIRVLYTKLISALDLGDYKSAEEFAIEAYLENFEYLEAEIEVVDPQLLYKLEIDMRENLRSMIKSKDSSDKIKDFIKNVILPDLEKAENLVLQNKRDSPPELGMNAQAISKSDLKQMGDASDDQKSIVRNEIDVIREKLESIVIYYENGDYQSAYASARSAYLDSYEFVEIPLRQIDPDFTLEVEFQFADLRKLISEQDEPEKIQNTIIAIKRNLDESERIVSGTGVLAPAIAFTSSFAIIFREGLESILILGAIITYLEASRNGQFKKYVYYGIVAAIGATAITWFIASFIIQISGASRELIEAIAALSATAVLFYVSFWILSKIEHKKWMEFVKAKVWQATTTGSVMVFVMLSFFTVYREGFETVLFYQAMFGFAKYMEGFVGLGFVLGIGSLLAIYYGMRRLGRRLPLRVLFGLTIGTGAYLSIAFLGNAIRELQIIDVMPYTSMIGIIPRLDINLAMMTGIYPTLETLVGQIILLGVYLFASSYVLILKPRKEQQIAAMRKSRKVNDE